MHDTDRHAVSHGWVTGGWGKNQRQSLERMVRDGVSPQEIDEADDLNASYSRLTREMDAFVKIIRETPEYRNYQAQSKRLAENPELKEAADSLRMDNYEMHMTASDEDITEEALKFASDNEDLCREPAVHDYLMAEASFCKMMQEVLDCLVKGIFDEIV